MIKLSSAIVALTTVAVASSIATSSQASEFTKRGSAVMLNPQPLPPGPPPDRWNKLSLSKNALKQQGIRRNLITR
jgi:hypothetical protein